MSVIFFARFYLLIGPTNIPNIPKPLGHQHSKLCAVFVFGSENSCRTPFPPSHNHSAICDFVNSCPPLSMTNADIRIYLKLR